MDPRHNQRPVDTYATADSQARCVHCGRTAQKARDIRHTTACKREQYRWATRWRETQRAQEEGT